MALEGVVKDVSGGLLTYRVNCFCGITIWCDVILCHFVDIVWTTSERQPTVQEVTSFNYSYGNLPVTRTRTSLHTTLVQSAQPLMIMHEITNYAYDPRNKLPVNLHGNLTVRYETSCCIYCPYVTPLFFLFFSNNIGIVFAWCSI